MLPQRTEPQRILPQRILLQRILLQRILPQRTEPQRTEPRQTEPRPAPPDPPADTLLLSPLETGARPTTSWRRRRVERRAQARCPHPRGRRERDGQHPRARGPRGAGTSRARRPSAPQTRTLRGGAHDASRSRHARTVEKKGTLALSKLGAKDASIGHRMGHRVGHRVGDRVGHRVGHGTSGTNGVWRGACLELDLAQDAEQPKREPCASE